MPVKTLEEITYQVWEAVHTPGKLSKEVIFEGLREAVAQERAALREAIDNESCEFWEGDHYGKRYKSGQPYDYEREHCTRCCLLARLDAREKAEKA